MAYAVKFQDSDRFVNVKLSTGKTLRVNIGSVQCVNTGVDGTTFYPAVEGEDCTLSWTNDGGKENPAPVNLRGKQGPQGAAGSDAEIAPITNLELEKILV